MSQNLHVTIVQSEIRWYQLDDNLQHLETLLKNVGNTDLIVLPEMFATGFVLDGMEQLAGGDRVLSWMNYMAQIHNAAVVGSVALQVEEHWYNRLLLVEPDGTVHEYDKRHLFVKSQEPKYFESGVQNPIIEYKGWRICPRVCYDLRFPVWDRNGCKNGVFDYDILLFVANWPQSRSDHWNTLLKARAIENQSYVVAANCAGIDPKGTCYSGDSQLVDFEGHVLQTANDGKEHLIQMDLSQDALQQYRQSFPVWKDWD